MALMQFDKKTKISILSYALSWGALFLFIVALVSIWYSLTGFGKDFLEVFNSINPNPFEVIFDYQHPEKNGVISNLLGILMNCFYALIDGIIIGLFLGLFYHLFMNLLEKKGLTDAVETIEQSQSRSKGSGS